MRPYTHNFYFNFKPEGLKITRHLQGREGIYAKLQLVPVDPVGGILFTEVRKVHGPIMKESSSRASVSALPSRQSRSPAHFNSRELGADNPRRSGGRTAGR